MLGFTDHVAWPFLDGFVSPVRMDAGQMPEYAASILKLKEGVRRAAVHPPGGGMRVFSRLSPLAEGAAGGPGAGVSHSGRPLSPQRGGLSPIRFCRRACELDLPLEYNLAGPRLRGASKGWGYTSDEFWDIAARYGCKAVVALDAHQPEVIGQVEDIAAARKKLAALGIQVLDRLPGLD